MLIDPQFSRFLRANADLSPYETVLMQMTNTPAVTLFHRFDLTQAWINTGQVDLERVSRDMRDKTIAALNDCLGEALARYVLAGGSRALVAGKSWSPLSVAETIQPATLDRVHRGSVRP